MNETRTDSALGPYRVLDLTDERGALCAKLLADLGADVIKIERPGGDAARDIGPFYHDEVNPEKSLHWFTFNTSKRSITLDITTGDGRRLLRRLVEKADFLIETYSPGYLSGLGLGYEALQQVNPGLVYVSITPFGQTGPYRDYRASDIVIQAMGGLMNLCGDKDRPPVRITASQGYLQASAQAAIGALMAFWHRQMTGEGQHVDVSMQEALIMTMDNSHLYWDMVQGIISRCGSKRAAAGIEADLLFRCLDGFVVCWAGVMRGENASALVEWMDSEGLAEDLLDDRWREWHSESGPAQITQEEIDHREAVFQRFCLTHTVEELYREAQARRLELCPVNSPKTLLANEQLATRNYFVEVEHPELGGSLTYPGAPFRMSETPWRIWHRAPTIGEHNADIYQEELGLSPRDLALLRQNGTI